MELVIVKKKKLNRYTYRQTYLVFYLIITNHNHVFSYHWCALFWNNIARLFYTELRGRAEFIFMYIIRVNLIINYHRLFRFRLTGERFGLSKISSILNQFCWDFAWMFFAIVRTIIWKIDLFPNFLSEAQFWNVYTG